MSQHIDNFVKGCPICVKDATPNSEPMIQTELPDFPWQRVASDLFMLNEVNYPLVADYFSRFPEVINRLYAKCDARALRDSEINFGRSEILEPCDCQRSYLQDA